jgi:hypothetical protein
MDVFRRAELNDLLEHEKEPCVSILLPTHRNGRDTEQDPIRLKNLLREAENQLTNRGVRSTDAREMLAEAVDLLNDANFWRHQSDGLAMFFSPGFQRRFRLPVTLEEAVHVNRRFCLRPLLPLLLGNGHFYVLSLSMKKVRLYRGTRLGLDELELEGVADNMADALLHEDLQSNLQHRSWGTRASNVRRSKQSLGRISGSGVVFHGQGSDENAQKPDIVEFFKQIDNAVTRQLQGETAPLVLACVEYEAALYRDHNHYRNLLDEPILGNPEQWNLTELHQRAWALAEPCFLKAQEEELNKFNRLPADRISTDLKCIAEAAAQGRVEALFVPRLAANGNSGNGGARRGAVSVVEDMLDDTASTVIRTGGDVFALPPDAMPQNAREAAAVFRYAITQP